MTLPVPTPLGSGRVQGGKDVGRGDMGRGGREKEVVPVQKYKGGWEVGSVSYSCGTKCGKGGEERDCRLETFLVNRCGRRRGKRGISGTRDDVVLSK